MAKDKKYVSRQQAEDLAKSVGAICYVECSSIRKLNMNDAIRASFIHLAQQDKLQAKKDCVLQ